MPVSLDAPHRAFSLDFSPDLFIFSGCVIWTHLNVNTIRVTEGANRKKKKGSAYHCQEMWSKRLQHQVDPFPILAQVN